MFKINKSYSFDNHLSEIIRKCFLLNNRFAALFCRQIESSLASPIFVPLRYFCEMNRTNPKREVLLLLLTEMQIRQPRVGYHLLYFLTVGLVGTLFLPLARGDVRRVLAAFLLAFVSSLSSSPQDTGMPCLFRGRIQKAVDGFTCSASSFSIQVIASNPFLFIFPYYSSVNDDKMAAYRNFCASQENPSLLSCLYRDLQVRFDFPFLGGNPSPFVCLQSISMRVFSFSCWLTTTDFSSATSSPPSTTW